jgi:hypothetical protein
MRGALGAFAFVAAISLSGTSGAEESNASDVIGTQETAFALAAGVGSAYDLLGFHLELSSPKAALFLGSGLPAVLLRDSKPGSAHYDLAAGVRFFSGHRDGAFFSLMLIQFDPGCEGCQSFRPYPDLSVGAGYQF